MNLEKIANSIPSMVNQETKNQLRLYASQIKLNRTIIEVGVWLGACTTQIALGLLDSQKNNIIHVYDRFHASRAEVKKAKSQRVILYEGERTKYIFEKNLKPFNMNININVGNIKNAKYKSDKIGIYIDDASKAKGSFDHAVKTFFKYFIPGETILFLCDYFYFRKTGSLSHEYQYMWMQKHKKEFELIKSIPNCSVAMFLYKGK